jgi:hypothetical protein
MNPASPANTIDGETNTAIAINNAAASDDGNNHSRATCKLNQTNAAIEAAVRKCIHRSPKYGKLRKPIFNGSAATCSEFEPMKWFGCWFD